MARKAQEIPASILRVRSAKLLAFHAQIIEELRAREIVRSSNNPSSDYAELLFVKAFNWQRKNNSNAGYDAEGNGNRYEIKCRRVTRHNESRQLSAIRNFEARRFDFIAGVIFNEDYSVYRAAIIPRRLVKPPHARWSKHVNGWLFRLNDDVWNLTGVEDVTSELKNAEKKLR